jgi:hypothetical protein
MVQSHELTSQVHDKAARLAEALRLTALVTTAAGGGAEKAYGTLKIFRECPEPEVGRVADANATSSRRQR